MSVADFKAKLLDAARRGQSGHWLVILPASGRAFRLTGVFFSLDMGGESRLVPYVLTDAGQPVAIDARALVLADSTLKPVWFPRDHIENCHAEQKKWYERNPDVFRRSTPAGVTAVLARD